MAYKVGDKVRVKPTNFTKNFNLNGLEGFVVQCSNNLYYVKLKDNLFAGYERTSIYLFDDQDIELSQIETNVEETTEELIAEIKNYQHKINILLNRLGSKIK